MQGPYYFIVGDRTKKTSIVYSTNVLEPTEETRTLLKRFRYTNGTASDVSKTVQSYIREQIQHTGGSHLLEAWQEDFLKRGAETNGSTSWEYQRKKEGENPGQFFHLACR